MKQPVFALVDCNNFFVSCERVFRPDLAAKPVAVLSNNDGCIVARSNEVRRLGVPMGAPEFKYRSVLRKHKVQIFSANFPLYGDFSRRVVEILNSYTPYMEVYSVDESFLEIGSLLIDDYAGWAGQVRASILRQTGIPVSVGIAPSKTLAKAASEIAKQQPGLNGVFSFFDLPATDKKQALKTLEVEDVWGIGRRLAPRLKQLHIRSAAELAAVSPRWVKQNLSVREERLVRELQGQPCYGLSQDSIDAGQKSIAATRSFGHTIRSIHELEMAVSAFVARAAIRLRKKHQIASSLSVFISTGHGAAKQWRPLIARPLPYPTADTSVLITEAIKGLSQIYNPDYGYRRAGIVLHGLLPKSAQQTTLDQSGQLTTLKRRDRMMQTLDEINRRYGTKTLKTAAEGTRSKEEWHSQREYRSPAYTTSWEEIVQIR